MPFPDDVRALVDRFHEQKADLKGAGYNETQLRREFLDPFFTALGWDVDNRGGQTEAYKDVIHEARVRLRAGDEAGATKAPDYAFRTGGVRKFFVEAKKPSVYILGNHSAAFQVRRYAWSDPDVRVAILTDFEEFAVYNGRVRPHQGDGPATHRLEYLTYDQYEARWDWLAGHFSRDAVLGGALDAYAEGAKAKRGTETPGDAFLKELDGWRETLAADLAARNPTLSARALNAAVQALLDRVVFLRIAEDRGIEGYGELKEAAKGQRVYPRLVELFREADRRYNSGLFYFEAERGRPGQPDTLAPRLDVSDRVLKPLIAGLYYPESPYAFDVLPTDLLGQVYERFLGKTIRLDGRRAVVEEKPEVKKAGGVYYTPTYVVDYIVRRTLTPLFSGRTPRAAEALAVLDPACGSGSFLLGAYDFLLGWYLDAYTADDPAKHARGRSPRLVQTPAGDWRLSLDEKKRILRAHLYGVDIDPQAVEVTKLSLLLRLLEGETAQTLDPQLSLLRERILPELADNVKSGNSLVGPDFYDGQPVDLFSADDHYRVNAFDWQAEFAAVMARGGFDAVVGNPPYVRQESLTDYKAYFEQHYASYAGTADLYVYFMERSVDLLNANGRYGIIVSRSVLHASYAARLRRFLREYSAVVGFVDFGGEAVFDAAKDTYTCIPLIAKQRQPDTIPVVQVGSLDGTSLEQHAERNTFAIPARRLEDSSWSLRRQKEMDTFTKMMERGIPLREYVDGRIYYGVKTGLNGVFIIDEATRRRLVAEDASSAALIKPLVGGQDIRRYHVRPTGAYLIFTRRGVDIGAYPAIQRYLTQYQEVLTPRPKNSKGNGPGRKPGSYAWYEIQDSVDYYEAFERPKIIYPDIAKGSRFHYDDTGAYIANTAYCLDTDDLYLLGILNSKLFWFAIGNISIPFGTRAGEFRYRLIYQYMEHVPIRPIDFDDPADVARHDRLVALVSEMLDLHRQRATADGHFRTLLDRRITATDREIDALVYSLYGLTPDEIALVEAATR